MSIHKVTAFITRTGRQGQPQLLLFQHPTAGVQLPAGTVDPGEDWATAVLREAFEETGLTALAVQGLLGQIENELTANEAVLTQDGRFLSQPNAQARPFDHWLTRGMTVQLLGNALVNENGRFYQVRYTEFDQLPNPQAITLELHGWLPQTHLSHRKTRHYVHLRCKEATPDRWTLLSDNNHTFAPFWVNLQPKPTVIVQPQNRWLDDVYASLLDNVAHP